MHLFVVVGFPVETVMLPLANVLGVGVHAIDMNSAVDTIENAIAARKQGYVCLTGVHGVMEAQRDPALTRVFANAMLVLPDGMPTVWIGHLQGFHQMDRVFGPQLMLRIAERSVQGGYSHFLCGGQPGVAEQLRDALVRRFPGITILGTYTPPFQSLTAVEERELVSQIEELRPQIVWVGMSTPRQELFMARYLPRLKTTLMIGVGAAFDFHTGRTKDSPQWVKRAGLQWAHRLAQEPRRLWKRYAINNPSFVVQALLQLAGIKHHHLQHYDYRF